MNNLLSMIKIAETGVYANQTRLNTTSHNIANAGVKGFSRQETVATARIHGGVQIADTRRVSDQFLVNNRWSATSEAAFYAAQKGYFEQAENIFAADSTNIASGLDNLFSSLNAAMLRPQDMAPRQGVMNEAKNLVHRFNNINDSLEQQFQQTEAELKVSQASFNDQLQQVASINRQIRDAGGVENAPPSLMDLRDSAVDELAGLVEISANQGSDGTLNLTLKNGQPLVSGTTAASLKLTAGSTGASLSLDYNHASFDLDKSAGGTLGALLDYRDGSLSQSRQFIDETAKAFADEFNGVQIQGKDLDGKQGKELFEFDDQDPAGTLKLTPQFTAQMLAFSKDGKKGDNSNLQDMAALATKIDLNSAYAAQVGKLGAATRQVKLDAVASEQSKLHAENQWSNRAGVNLDEEAINLISYQQAYQANAKVLSTADQLFNTLLNSF